MNLDDSRIRQMILAVRPDIPPKVFEVAEIDYGAAVSFWFRPENGQIIAGRTIALQRTEQEIAEELLSQIVAEEVRRKFATAAPGADIRVQISVSPYEGKRGKHPQSCTCSKHLRALS